ncbi:MAG: peptide chain release factor N(5)-glutamine methyltransferase [Tangfeifania sp.]
MEPTIQYIEKELNGIYPASEIRGFIRLIFEHVCGMSYTDQILRRDEEIDSASKKKIKEIVHRLKNYEPLQYILGETEFFGMKLRVEPGVLIPRPETEELVKWIVDSANQGSPSILDIGTGSGCIALALKNEMKNSRVSAVDFSTKALEIAKGNARLNQLNVKFIKADILNWGKYKWGNYDIIVSNPPYVRELEKKAMFANVLDYEPGEALFVSNDDPLVFYREIGNFAQTYLEKDGELYFEINENLGHETAELMRSLSFRDVELKKDINGKVRMLRCRK